MDSFSLTQCLKKLLHQQILIKKKAIYFPPDHLGRGACSALSQAPAIKAVLKGLSHDIDFTNFDKNVQNLVYITKGRRGFSNFWGI